MGFGIYSAAAGATARQTQIDVAAHNLANVSTHGYRAVEQGFESVLMGQRTNTDGHMVAAAGTRLDMKEAPMIQTKNPLDLALDGAGFFEAEDPEGRTVLLRTVAGRLDGEGRLTDGAGNRLRLTHDVEIRADQAVEITDAGEVRQGGVVVAELMRADVQDPGALMPLGGAAYLPTEASGEPLPVSTAVRSGHLEGSNVSAVESMVRLIGLERDHQSILRAIHAYREADEGLLDTMR